MPRHKAPEGRRQRTNTASAGVLATRSISEIPEQPKPPAGKLLAVTVAAWEQFWTSDVSQLVSPASDAPALRRLFLLYDERERCQREAARTGRVVSGSTGQPTLSPLYKHIGSIDSTITTLEDRFGLTPLARLKLGAQLGDASKSLDEMNRRLLDDDDGDEFDPRIIDLPAS